MGWCGLVWVGLVWFGLGSVALPWLVGGWGGVGWVGLGWVGLGWVGLVGWLVGWPHQQRQHHQSHLDRQLPVASGFDLHEGGSRVRWYQPFADTN